MLDDAPYSLAIVPVMAPQRIGWVAMGSAGAQATRSLHAHGPGRRHRGGRRGRWRLVGTSLAPEQAKALVREWRTCRTAMDGGAGRAQLHLRMTTADPACAGAVDVVLLADVDDAM